MYIHTASQFPLGGQLQHQWTCTFLEQCPRHFQKLHYATLSTLYTLSTKDHHVTFIYPEEDPSTCGFTIMIFITESYMCGQTTLPLFLGSTLGFSPDQQSRAILLKGSKTFLWHFVAFFIPHQRKWLKEYNGAAPLLINTENSGTCIELLWGFVVLFIPHERKVAICTALVFHLNQCRVLSGKTWQERSVLCWYMYWLVVD